MHFWTVYTSFILYFIHELINCFAVLLIRKVNIKVMPNKTGMFADLVEAIDSKIIVVVVVGGGGGGGGVRVLRPTKS